MITINFYKDGAYVKGHDEHELCTLVSYAMFCLTNDTILANDDVFHYASGTDKKWERLGFMYVKFNPEVPAHQTIFDNFRGNLWNWVATMYGERIKVNDYPEENINWDSALRDAKEEQGYTL